MNEYPNDYEEDVWSNDENPDSPAGFDMDLIEELRVELYKKPNSVSMEKHIACLEEFAEFPEWVIETLWEDYDKYVSIYGSH